MLSHLAAPQPHRAACIYPAIYHENQFAELDAPNSTTQEGVAILHDDSSSLPSPGKACVPAERLYSSWHCQLANIRTAPSAAFRITEPRGPAGGF